MSRLQREVTSQGAVEEGAKDLAPSICPQGIVARKEQSAIQDGQVLQVLRRHEGRSLVTFSLVFSASPPSRKRGSQ